MRNWGRGRGRQTEIKLLGQKKVGQRTDRGEAGSTERERERETRTMETKRGLGLEQREGLISPFILPHIPVTPVSGGRS